MRARKFAPVLAILALAAVCFPDVPAKARATSDASRSRGNALRVLFIGNSHTRYNNLPYLVRRLLEASGKTDARTEMVTIAGSNLRPHWYNRSLRSRIEHGDYSHIVLQAHSKAPVDRPAETQRLLTLFNGEAVAHGAKTVLYNTWARRGRSPRPGHLAQNQAVVDAFYQEVGAATRAIVAPVGQAWSLTRATAPRIELYRGDGIHPTLAGSYLAACVFYGVFTDESPEALSYVPFPLPRSSAEKLRQAAADALRERALLSGR